MVTFLDESRSHVVHGVSSSHSNCVLKNKRGVEMLKQIMRLLRPRGNPMCKDCGFFLSCEACNKKYSKRDIKLKKRGK